VDERRSEAYEVSAYVYDGATDAGEGRAVGEEKVTVIPFGSN
jgi:hypothetical protein